MRFLAPGMFFLAGLIPVIVLMWLLKLRRVERAVSSTFLWRQMVRDVEANAPWQKLRYNLLLLLQVLFLAALVLALARPATPARGITARAAIFIIDTSASMAASDVNPSRIEAAKDKARQMIGELPAATQVTVIAAGDEARV
ncbi:MAG: vWA domain-containing protein, partial [Chloroflexota bacterium]